MTESPLPGAVERLEEHAKHVDWRAGIMRNFADQAQAPYREIAEHDAAREERLHADLRHVLRAHAEDQRRIAELEEQVRSAVDAAQAVWSGQHARQGVLLARAKEGLRPFALAANLDPSVEGTERLRLLRGMVSLQDFAVANSIFSEIE